MFRSIAILTLCLVAFTANATIVRVEYEATVQWIEGNGLGYSIGDQFTRQFFIDTTAVEWTQHCDVYPGVYANCDYAGRNLVSGFTPLPADNYSIHVNDRFYDACSGCEDDTEAYVIYGTSYEYEGEQLIASRISNFWIHDAEREFLTGNSLEQNFTLLRGTSYYGGMYGRFSEWIAMEDVHNSMDYLASRVTFTTVPLPPAVWLFGSALGVMGWMRRTTSKKLDRSSRGVPCSDP